MCCQPPCFMCVCVCVYTVLTTHLLDESSRQRLYTHTTGDLSEEMVWLDFGGPRCIYLHINEQINQAWDGAARVLLVCNCDIINNHVTTTLIKSHRLSSSSHVSASDLTKNIHSRDSSRCPVEFACEDVLSAWPNCGRTEWGHTQAAWGFTVNSGGRGVKIWSERYHQWNTVETWFKRVIYDRTVTGRWH